MREQGIKCKCIRCHEVGLNHITLEHVSEVGLVTERYRASGAEERFISFEIEGSMGLVGYARLRLPDKDDVARLRELKVFGQMAQLGKKEEHWQHRGFGKELVAESERQADTAGYRALSVTSGVGVRRYYLSQGYQRNGVYMTKELKAT
jgi:elongator complex protein 3